MAMARPMGRPSNPPLALIATVVLFVIAAAAAVAMYVQWDKSKLDLAATQGELSKARADLAAAQGRFKLVAERVSPGLQATDPGAGDRARASLDGLLKTVALDLSKPGESANTYGNADWAATDVIKRLAEDRKRWYDLATDLDQKLNAAIVQSQAKDTRVTQFQGQVAALDEKYLKERADLTKRNDDEVNRRDARISALTAEKAKAEADLNREKISQMDLIRSHEQEKSRLNNEIIRLNTILAQRDQSLIDKIKFGPAKLPDGTVVQVFPERNQVYLRLNEPEKAKLGMRYAIMGKGQGIANSGQGKAVVQIKSLEGGTIQAEIEKNTAGDPIIVGDVALNLVTGPVKFNFVVFGDFDLNNDQLIEPNGQAQIAALITRWGGNVMDEVDISTNFLVLGVQPQIPASAPAPGADPLVVKQYEDRLAANKRWATLHDLAGKYTIPMLNPVTFLHWIGYYNDDTGPGWERRVRPGEDYFGM